MKKPLIILFTLLCILSFKFTFAQPAADQIEPSRFDFGKMWTFEHPPLDYFEKTYGFRPSAEWLENTRMSALRFASYCSASFISSEGMVLTNHHCSRGEVGKVMKDGEDFDKTGFYAKTQEEERQVPGLFVKQLVQMADVTDSVKKYTNQANNEQEIAMLRDSAFQLLKDEYSNKEAWKGLEIEPVSYYNGGKYSFYGYKRYDDVRLVLIPELNLGFFGGDPDNFTYPRYSLDFTVWRVYENGQPLNTSDNYFQVNPKGAVEKDLVFAISNPGSTERYRTMAQLEYDRDYRYNIMVDRYSKSIDIMQEQYDQDPSHDLQEMIFGLSNALKANSGILKGLHDPYLMGKKKAMEAKIKAKSKSVASGNDYWDQLATEYKALHNHAAEINMLGPSPFGGNALISAHYVKRFQNALENGASESDLNTLKAQVKNTASELKDPFEVKILSGLLADLKKHASKDDKYIDEILGGETPEVAAKMILKKTKFSDEKKLDKLLNAKPKKLAKSKDPIMKMANLILPKYQEAVQAFRSSIPVRRALEGKIANEAFQVYGLDIPPDATFTLRMADGVVGGYEYNGTIAPFKTSFYGMYDRYYSNDGEFPWALPERWMNPPMALLKAPLNFVSTSDSIGGSSGSPIINNKGEMVGILFDGNIESLPGNFIYDITVNRSVGVHAGGITAALKYIYNADRILQELGVE